MITSKGFTLIEFLLYIGIVGIVVGAAGAIALNVLFGGAKLAAIEEVSQNARFAMERISQDVRNAERIESPPSGRTDSTLKVRTQGGKIEFKLDEGVITRKEEEKHPVALTSDEVTVTGLRFQNISYSGTPGTLRIEMTLRFRNPSGRPEYEYEETFYTTTNIRKRN